MLTLNHCRPIYFSLPSTSLSFLNICPPEKPAEVSGQRSSPRLQGKLSKGKSVIKMAQELVATKSGIIDQNQDLDNVPLQQYINLYKHPSTEDTIETIEVVL
jgi:hypothetical protein